MWMLRQVRSARFVLIIASPEYRRRGDGDAEPDDGRGVQWEAALIREELYANRRVGLQKFVPVILPGRSIDDIPTWLGPRSTSVYAVTDFTVAGAGDLLRLLTGQPEETPPPLGQPPPLPPGQPRLTGSIRRQGGSTVRQGSQAPADDAAQSFAPLCRLFLHYFDPHFLDEVARGRNSNLVEAEARLATRLAVLAAKTVFVPAASYIESDLCTNTINEYRGIFDTGQIVLIGGEANMVDFALAKLVQYDEGGERFRKYEAILSSTATTPPFRTRTGSATRDITAAWLSRLNDLSEILDGLPIGAFGNLETRWAEVPQWLRGRAFTPEYAVRGLFDDAQLSTPERIVARRAGSHVNNAYFGSYTGELGAGLVTELVYLQSGHRGSESVDVPYLRLVRELTRRRVLDQVKSARPERLAEIRHDEDVAAAIVSSIESPPTASAPDDGSPAPLQLIVTDPMPKGEWSAPSQMN